jgi:hypothetical protein
MARRRDNVVLLRVAQYHRQRSAILAIAVEIGRIGSIRIVRSPAVHGPVAFGILDRIIAVPCDFDARFSEEERRLALEHEFTHHRAGDLIANGAALLLLCVQWFNPLAWVAHAAFRLDQEAACDSRLLDKGRKRSAYGRAIAKAASGHSFLLAAALGRRSTLHRRLNYMLGTSTARQRLAGRVLVATAIALAAPLTASHAISYVNITPGVAHRSRTAQRFDENRPGTATVVQPEIAQRPRRGTELAAIEPVAEGEVVGASTPQAIASKLEADQRKRNAERSGARQDQAKRDAEQAERAEDQAKRDVEQSERAHDQVKIDAEQAEHAEEKAKRDAERAQHDRGKAQPTADPVRTNSQ